MPNTMLLTLAPHGHGKPLLPWLRPLLWALPATWHGAAQVVTRRSRVQGGRLEAELVGVHSGLG